MAMCTGCHRQISAAEARSQQIQKDDQNRVVTVYHGKCWVRHKRQNWVGTSTGKYYADSPNAYQMAQRRKTADDLTPEAVQQQQEIERAWAEHLGSRQDQIAEQRSKEESPKRHDDWRDPLEIEL